MTTLGSTQSTRRYEILTGVVLLGLTLGMFLVGEIGLRLVQFAKFGVEESVEKSSAFYVDDVTGLRLINPNRQLGQVRINNLGYRGPDIPERKSNGVIRILFLGSSTTYEANITEGKNWPHMTVNLLSKFYPDCRFDFINAGQPGFGTKTLLTLYNSRLKSLDVDIAILLPGDINQDLDWLAAEQGFDTRHYQPSALASLSILWAKLEKNFRIIELQRSAFSHAGKLRLDLELIQGRFRDRLQRLTDTLLEDGLTVFVAQIGSQLRRNQTPEKQLQAANTNLFYMPHVALPDLIATREGYNEVIAELPDYNSVDILHSTLLPPADRNHYTDTMHFTARGSALMADATFKELMALPRFQQRLQQLGCTTP